MQTWTGNILRAKIPYSLSDLKKIQQNCRNAAMNFLRNNDLDFINISFEEFIVSPEETIEKINSYLGTKLKLEDLKKVYKGTLYKRRWSIFDYSKAILKSAGYKYILKKNIKFEIV